MAKHENENEMKEKKPKIRIVLFIFFILALLTSGFAIYEIFLLSSIETLMRYIVIGILILIDLFYSLKYEMSLRNEKRNVQNELG